MSLPNDMPAMDPPVRPERCVHDWQVVQTEMVEEYGTTEIGGRLRETAQFTDRLRVLGVCVNCRRYISFEALPVED